MTNHNIPTHTPDHQLTPEQIRERDPGADVIDVARDLHDSIYMGGNYNDSIFENNDEGEPGAYQLIELANRLRHENRSELTGFEEQFVDYMKQASEYHKSVAVVDFDAIHETDDDPEAGIKAIAEDLKVRIANAAPDEKLPLVSKLYAIEEYLDLDLRTDDENLGSQFMSVHYDAQAASGSEKVVLEADAEYLSDMLSEKYRQTQKVIHAYEVLAEYHPRIPGDPADLDENPLLVYEPISNEPIQPHMTRRARWVQNRRDRNDAAAARIEQRKADMAESVSMLGDEHMEQLLKDHRSEVAEKKSQTVMNTLRSYKFGRQIMGVLQGKTHEEYAAKVHAKEHLYNAIVLEKIRRDNADTFAELPADATDEDRQVQRAKQASAIAKGIIKEQEALRPETDKIMKDKIPVKIGKFVMDHKIATVAGATLLLPILGGSAAVGLSIGLGAYAGAKMDKRFRGLRETEKTLNYTKLFERASQSHAGGGDIFQDMQEFAMHDLDSNVKRELFLKRVVALGTIGTIAVGGSLALPSTGGGHSVHSFDYWVNQNSTFVEGAYAGTLGASAAYKIWKNKKKSAGGGH